MSFVRKAAPVLSASERQLVIRFAKKFECCYHRMQSREFPIYVNINSVMKWNLIVSKDNTYVIADGRYMNPLSMMLEGSKVRKFNGIKLDDKYLFISSIYPYLALEYMFHLPDSSLSQAFSQGFENQPHYLNVYHTKPFTAIHYQLFEIGRFFLHKYCNIRLEYPNLDESLFANEK